MCHTLCWSQPQGFVLVDELLGRNGDETQIPNPRYPETALPVTCATSRAWAQE